MSDLARKTVNGATLNVAVTLFKNVLQLAILLPILARLISPAEFGYVGMAMTFVAAFTMFNDLGISAALVRDDAPSPAFWSSAFWTNIGLGVTVATATYFAAPAIAAFYNQPIVEPLTEVLAVILLMHCAFLVPMAWLQRNFRFGAIALIEFASTVVSSIIVIVMALRGYGVWALVAQQISLYVVKLAGAFLFQRAPIRLIYKFSEIAAVLPFSLRLTGEAFITFVNRKADSILVGRFLGAAPLGFYDRAYQIMLVPVSSLSLGAGFALYPAMSSIKHETERLKLVYLKSISVLGGVAIPMMAGLALVSEPFVALVFGPDWKPVVPVLSILAFAGVIQTLSGPSNVLWKSLGKSDVLLYWVIARMFAFLVAFAIGIHLGSITALSAAYLIANVAMYLPYQAQTLRHMKMPIMDYLRVMAPTVISTLGMAATILALEEYLPAIATLPSYGQLGVLVPAGVAAYLACMLLLFRPFVRELIGEARELFDRKQKSAPAE